MNRQPRNVVVYLFRRVDAATRFLLLRRSDNGVWQAVCGGAERDETLEAAARRELREEVGLMREVHLDRLDAIGGAPRTGFDADAYWPSHVHVVEKHFFGAEMGGDGDPTLSEEHSDFAWLGYREALDRLAHSDERTALWELNARIEKGDLDTDSSLARRIEDASLRAWPAVESASLDGWELRSSGGFSKRASSVQPFSGSSRAISDKVDECETWYRSRGSPVVFRLTPFSDAGLDDHLDGRGYQLVEPTDVLAMSLPTSMDDSPSLDLIESPLEDWVRTYLELSGRPADTAPSLRGTLEACTRRRTLVKLVGDERDGPAACGMAALDRDLVGLFDLVTAERHRRRGFATALVAGLVGWGHARGARHAYLQVVGTNVPAQALYRKLRFTAQYRYWYRVRPV